MINDIFRTAVNFTLQGVSGVLTGHWRQSTDNMGSSSDMSVLASCIESALPNTLAEGLSIDWESQSVDVQTVVVPPTPPMVLHHTFGDPIGGAVETTALPPLVAVVIRRRTAFAGRRYRGRQYVAGLAQADALDGSTTSAWQAANNARFISWVADVLTGGGSGDPSFTPCIAVLDPTVTSPIPGIRVTDISSGDVDTVLRQQRRRQVGVGS